MAYQIYSTIRSLLSRLDFSGYSVHTIADLAGCEHILQPHLAEAIQYRSPDRKIV